MKQRYCPCCKSVCVVSSYLEWLGGDLLAKPKTKIWECLDCGCIFSDKHPEKKGEDLTLPYKK